MIFGPRGAELKLFYEASLGDLVSVQSGGIKGSLPLKSSARPIVRYGS